MARPKLDPDFQLQRAIRVAEMYFQQGLARKEIAQQLDVSPATVSRSLKQARQEKLVYVLVRRPLNERLHSDLTRILHPHGIRDLRIAGPSREDVGREAADFFQAEGSSGSTVVIDGGRTIRSFVDHFQPGTFPSLTIIPSCADPPSDGWSAYEMMTRLSVKVPSAELQKLPHHRSAFLDQLHERIQQVAGEAQFVLLGAALFQPPYPPPDFIRHLGFEAEHLRAKYPKIVTISGNYALDREGSEVPVEEFSGNMPRAIEFDRLREMAKHPSRHHVAVLAAGAEKRDALLAILKARICNTLILDEGLAAALLETEGTGREGGKKI